MIYDGVIRGGGSSVKGGADLICLLSQGRGGYWSLLVFANKLSDSICVFLFFLFLQQIIFLCYNACLVPFVLIFSQC